MLTYAESKQAKRALITTDDYAVRFKIPHKMYLNFKAQYDGNKPVLAAFEEKLTEEIEKWILEKPEIQKMIEEKR